MLLWKISEKEKRERECVCVCVCEKKVLSSFGIWSLWSAIWNSERGLLPLGFGSMVCWFALSWCITTFEFALWLSLVCMQFVFGICEPLVPWFVFGSLVLYLWERAIWVYWDWGLWECLYTNLYYSKFVIVKFVRRHPWM